MNKLFIGLLIAAAGAGVFFLLYKKKNAAINDIKKEWIVGKWKADAGKDSVLNQYRYDFLKDGNIIRSLNDSAKADTMHYGWDKENALIWKNNPADSTGRIYSVVKLTQDSLQVESKDSTRILFTRIK